MSTNPHVDQKLRTLIRKHGTIKGAAEECGICVRAIGELLKNPDQHPSKATLKKLGFRVPKPKLPGVVAKWIRSKRALNYTAIAAEAGVSYDQVRWYVGATKRKKDRVKGASSRAKYTPSFDEIWGKGGLAEQCREAHFEHKRQEAAHTKYARSIKENVYKHPRLVTP